MIPRDPVDALATPGDDGPAAHKVVFRRFEGTMLFYLRLRYSGETGR